VQLVQHMQHALADANDCFLGLFFWQSKASDSCSFVFEDSQGPELQAIQSL